MKVKRSDGTVQDVNESYACRLVERGMAEFVPEKPKPAQAEPKQEPKQEKGKKKADEA